MFLQPVKYNLDSSSDELFSNDEAEVVDTQPKAIELSDSDSDARVPSPEPMNTNDLFDSLVEDKPVEKPEPKKEAKKAPEVLL